MLYDAFTAPGYLDVMWSALRNPRTDLPWLITLHMIAFLGYHVTVEFNFSLWFQVLVFKRNEFLSSLVGQWIWLSWTLGLSALFAYLFCVSQKNRVFTGGFFLITFYCFYEYDYPVASAVLEAFDHIEPNGYMVTNQMPPMDVYSEAIRPIQRPEG